MGRDPCLHCVGSIEPLPGQRTVCAELARQARQEPGRSDIREKADADLGHREAELVARDAMRAVHRDAYAAAHDDAVDQRYVGLAIEFDAGIERVLRPKEIERFL